MKKYLKLSVLLLSLVFISSVYAEDFVTRKPNPLEYKAFIDRNLEPETRHQIFRIIADGGTVVDYHYMNNVIKKLKALGLYSSCKLLVDVNFAYKNAGAGLVPTLYSVDSNNNDVIQAVGAKQPIWTASVQNGRAGVVFNGTSQFLSCAAPTGLDLTDALTFITVVKANFNAVSTGFVLMKNGSLASASAVYALETNKSVADRYFKFEAKDSIGWANINAGTGAVVTNDTFYLLSVIYDKINAVELLNGAAYASNPANTSIVTSTGAFNVGGYNLTSWDASEYFKGTISAVIVFDVALSTVQRQALEGLLNTYYAIY